jgi:hypothetical protein
MPRSETIPELDLRAISYQATLGRVPQATLADQTGVRCLSHLLVVVCTAVVCAHWPVLRSEAVYIDDDQYLIENPLVQNPCLHSAKLFFAEVIEPSTVRGYYQPLTMLSLMIDNSLWGRQSGNLRPFHRTSLALHVANVALLVLLLYLLFGNPWAAAVAGLLFGLHPITVETVVWISERKTLLASFWALCSLICYVGYIRGGKPRALYACCIIMYLLALLCKPTVIVLPFLLLLMDFWPLRRLKSILPILVEKTPLFVLCVASGVVTYVSQSRSAGIELPNEYGISRIPLMLCHNLVFYLQKVVYPICLSPHYSSPEPFGFVHPRLFLSVISTVLIVVLLALSLRWTPAVVLSFTMFFVALLPTMQIVRVTNEIVANRYLYLPSWALLLLGAAFLMRLFGRIHHQRFLLLPALLLILLLFIGEAVCLRSYLAHWYDTLSLHRYILTIAPDAYKVENNLGIALLRQGRVTQAINHFRRAAQLAEREGSSALAYANLGQTLIKSGAPHSGCSYLEKAVVAEKVRGGAAFALAWRLATHPDPTVANPSRALELVKDATSIDDKPTVGELDTLAAAYAANNQFALAIETANKALNLATKENNKPLAASIRSRLRLYQEGHRYYEDPTVEAWVRAVR